MHTRADVIVSTAVVNVLVWQKCLEVPVELGAVAAYLALVVRLDI